MELLEKVEKLVEKTGVSYEDAKKALEESGGDLLDAIILLEKQHKTGEAKTAFYSTGDAMDSSAAGAETEGNAEVVRKGPENRKNRESRRQGSDNWTNFKTEVRRLLDLSIRNRFTIRRKSEELLAIPTIALIILLIFAFWITLILLVVGLFFGCRYSFEYQGKTAEKVNDILDRAADTAENIKRDFSQNNDGSDNNTTDGSSAGE